MVTSFPPAYLPPSRCLGVRTGYGLEQPDCRRGTSLPSGGGDEREPCSPISVVNIPPPVHYWRGGWAQWWGAGHACIRPSMLAFIRPSMHARHRSMATSCTVHGYIGHATSGGVVYNTGRGGGIGWAARSIISVRANGVNVILNWGGWYLRKACR